MGIKTLMGVVEYLLLSQRLNDSAIAHQSPKGKLDKHRQCAGFAQRDVTAGRGHPVDSCAEVLAYQKEFVAPGSAGCRLHSCHGRLLA